MTAIKVPPPPEPAVTGWLRSIFVSPTANRSTPCLTGVTAHGTSVPSCREVLVVRLAHVH